MGLMGIDTSIYQNAPQSYLRAGLDGYDNGMQARGLMARQQQDKTLFAQQQAEVQRQQAFTKTLGQLSQQFDYRTPEGQQGILQGLGKNGFGPEAMDLAQKLQKQNAKDAEWRNITGTGTLYNSGSGDTKDTGVVPYQKPLVPKDPLAEAKFQELKRMNDAKIAAMNRPKDEKPSGMGSAMTNRSLLSDWGKSRFDYEKAAKPYLALKAIEKSPSYGSGVGDQSMIDKIIMIETGKVPTEAQYFQFANNLGIADKVDKTTGKLMQGAILGPVARKHIQDQADEQMKLSHSSYQSDYGQAEQMAKENGVDPAKVLRHGGYYGEVDKILSGKAGKPAGAPASIPTFEQYDSLPSGAQFTDPQGNIRQKR